MHARHAGREEVGKRRLDALRVDEEKEDKDHAAGRTKGNANKRRRGSSAEYIGDTSEWVSCACVVALW